MAVACLAVVAILVGLFLHAWMSAEVPPPPIHTPKKLSLRVSLLMALDEMGKHRNNVEPRVWP